MKNIIGLFVAIFLVLINVSVRAEYVYKDFYQDVRKGEIDNIVLSIGRLNPEYLNYPFTRDGGSMLHAVLQSHRNLSPKNKKKLVQVLLEHGSDPNYQDNKNRTPVFYLSSSEDDIELLEVFIEANAKIDMRDIEGKMLMHVFSQNNSSGLVKFLLLKGSSHNVFDYGGVSPLMLAISRRASESIDALLNAGADINAVDKKGNSVIHYAAKARDIRLVDFVVDKGVPIDLKNSDSESALSLFVSSRQWSSVRHLLKRGADPNSPMKRGGSVGLYLLTNPDLGMSHLISKEKMNVNALEKSSVRSSFLSALKSSDIEKLRLLISLGLDVNTRFLGGEHALPFVAGLDPGRYKNKLAILELLIKNGADVEARSAHNNYTALFLASQENYADVVELMLKHGAMVDAKHPRAGETSLDIAIENNNVDVVQILLSHGATMRAGMYGMLPQSLNNKRFEVALLLLNNGYEIDFQNEILWSGIGVLVERVEKDESDGKDTAAIALFKAIFSLWPIVDLSQDGLNKSGIQYNRKKLENSNSQIIKKGLKKATFINERERGANDSVNNNVAQKKYSSNSQKIKELVKVDIPLRKYNKNAELHVIGVYQGEAKSAEDDEPWWSKCGKNNSEMSSFDCHRKFASQHPERKIIVEIYAKEKPVVLALMSYEPAEWVIINRSGGTLDGVILAGHHSQRASGLADSVPINVYTSSASACGRCQVGDRAFFAYKRGSKDFRIAMRHLRELTKRDPVSFQGAYKGKMFSIIDN